MRNIFDDFNIGEMVKKQLRIKKISQEQLSVMLGIPKTNTNRLLGNSSIDTDKLNKICEAIDYNFYAEICNDWGRVQVVELTRPHVGNLIAKRMAEMGITQYQLATYLGTKQPYVSTLLKKASMDTKKLLTLSQAMKYSFFKDFYHGLFQSNMPSGDNNEDVIEARPVLLDRYERLVIENDRLKARIRLLEELLKKNDIPFK